MKIVLDFFYYKLHYSKVSPSTLSSYRSILKWYVHSSFFPILDHILVSRFISGAHALHFKPFPRPRTIWDVNQVLDYFRNQPDNTKLSLMQLSVKLVLLLLLSSFRRKSELLALHLDHKFFFPGKVLFALINPPKTKIDALRRARHLAYFPVTAFSAEPDLCPLNTLNHYLKRTASIRSTRFLLIQTQNPFSNISGMTLRRWILSGLKSAGIDVSQYTSAAYSTRHAASSKAFMAGVQLDVLLKKAGWSNVSTFVSHYNLPVVSNDVPDNTNSVFDKFLKQPTAFSSPSSAHIRRQFRFSKLQTSKKQIRGAVNSRIAANRLLAKARALQVKNFSRASQVINQTDLFSA